MVLDRQSSGIRLTVKWYWIDSQVGSHWHSSDEIQVTSDWLSSGIGSTVKLYLIDSQVVLDLQSSGTGLTVKWYWIDSQVVSQWLSCDEIQVSSDWPSSGI